MEPHVPIGVNYSNLRSQLGDEIRNEANQNSTRANASSLMRDNTYMVGLVERASVAN